MLMVVKLPRSTRVRRWQTTTKIQMILATRSKWIERGSKGRKQKQLSISKSKIA